jgi:hypothetical protein
MQRPKLRGGEELGYMPWSCILEFHACLRDSSIVLRHYLCRCCRVWWGCLAWKLDLRRLELAVWRGRHGCVCPEPCFSLSCPTPSQEPTFFCRLHHGGKMLDLAGNDRAGACHVLGLVHRNLTPIVISYSTCFAILNMRLETRDSSWSGKDPDAPPCPHYRTLTGNRDIGDVKTDSWRRSLRRKVRC